MAGLKTLLGALLGTAALGMVAPDASATRLACKPDVKETTYARGHIKVPRADQPAFRRRVEDWGEATRYSASSVVFEDPCKTPPLTEWTSFLVPETSGVSLIIEGNSLSDTVELSIENNCWAEQEEWRPHWRKLRIVLSEWGYR